MNTLADWGLTGLALVLAAVGIMGLGTVRTRRDLQRLGEKAGSRAGLYILSATQAE